MFYYITKTKLYIDYSDSSGKRNLPRNSRNIWSKFSLPPLLTLVRYSWVGDALVIRQKIVQHKAVLYGTAACLQACNVPRFNCAHEVIDNLLERLDTACSHQVIIFKAIDSAVDNLLHRIFEHNQLALCPCREYNVLFFNLSRSAKQVGCMVADAFKIADGVQQGVDQMAVLQREGPGRTFDQLGRQRVCVLGRFVLLPAYSFCTFFIPAVG